MKFIFEMEITMQTINTLAKEFLTHNRIAVAGASGKTHNVGNYIYSIDNLTQGVRNRRIPIQNVYGDNVEFLIA